MTSKFAVTRGDRPGWMRALWAALDAGNECDQFTDDDWDEICTAMAWVAEDLGLEPDGDGEYTDLTGED